MSNFLIQITFPIIYKVYFIDHDDLRRFCGNADYDPIQIIMHSDLVLALFESDDYLTYSGFKFTYYHSHK